MAFTVVSVSGAHAPGTGMIHGTRAVAPAAEGTVFAAEFLGRLDAGDAEPRDGRSVARLEQPDHPVLTVTWERPADTITPLPPADATHAVAFHPGATSLVQPRADGGAEGEEPLHPSGPPADGGVITLHADTTATAPVVDDPAALLVPPRSAAASRTAADAAEAAGQDAPGRGHLSPGARGDRTSTPDRHATGHVGGAGREADWAAVVEQPQRRADAAVPNDAAGIGAQAHESMLARFVTGDAGSRSTSLSDGIRQASSGDRIVGLSGAASLVRDAATERAADVDTAEPDPSAHPVAAERGESRSVPVARPVARLPEVAEAGEERRVPTAGSWTHVPIAADAVERELEMPPVGPERRSMPLATAADERDRQVRPIDVTRAVEHGVPSRAAHERSPSIASEQGLTAAPAVDEAKGAGVLPTPQPGVAAHVAGQDATNWPASLATRLARALGQQGVSTDDLQAGETAIVQEGTADSRHERGAFEHPRGEAAAPMLVRQVSPGAQAPFELAPALQRLPESVAPTTHAAGHASGAPGEAPARQTLDQLVQAIRMQYRNGLGEAVLRLQPQHLGAVSIALRVEHGVVSATLQAEQPGVRHWLESQQAALRQGLAAQGLHLDRFVVEPDRREPDRRRHDAPPPRRQTRDAGAADTATFEVRV